MNLAQRIQGNPILLLGLGVALILAALALIWLNLSSRTATTAKPATQQETAGLVAEGAVSVIVAARNVVRGQALSTEDLTRRKNGRSGPRREFR
ncbi:hypothetical protein [Parvibaculum sp.]|uniref:hypothetical protein n=1 Tax=Parvibaculum sp. TaxID=2024848 RepID=UPI003BABFE27